MLDFNPSTIDSHSDIDAIVDNLDSEELNQAFRQAVLRRQLNSINHLLEIPDVFNNTSLIKDGLFTAIYGGQVNIIKRLLQTPAVENIDTESAIYLLQSAIIRASEDSFQVVNYLLEVQAIRNSTHRLNNQVLHCALNRRRLDHANRLLEIPRVVAELKTMDREGYISMYRQVLDAVSCEASIKLEEIQLVNKLRDIGAQYQMTDADFTKKQLINAQKCTRDDLLTALLYALDETSDELATKHSISPAYNEASSSVAVYDDEPSASPKRPRCVSM